MNPLSMHDPSSVRRRPRFLMAALAFLLALVPLGAMAADGYISAYVNLRAGPDARYPRVTLLRPGMAVTIYGCLDSWSWCDVGVDGWRGWISAAYVRYPYRDQRVVVASYGPRIGLPIVGFVLGTYWGDHYRNRTWYGERDRWERRGYGPPPRRTGPQRPPEHGRNPPGHRPMPQRPTGPEHGGGKPGRTPAHRQDDHSKGGGHGHGGGY